MDRFAVKCSSVNFDKVLSFLQAMNEEKVDYIVFGGFALNAHGIVRATIDLDLFVRPEAGNIDRLRRALRRVWNDPHIDEISVNDLAGEYPAIQYGPPDEDLTIDIVARLGEAFAFEDLEAETIAMENVPIRVVTARTLHEMKRNTVRPRDRADAEALRAKFGFEE